MTTKPEDARETRKKPDRVKPQDATWIAFGTGAGVALGLVMGNLALGIALGAGVGVALMAVMSSRRNGD